VFTLSECFDDEGKVEESKEEHVEFLESREDSAESFESSEERKRVVLAVVFAAAV